MPSELIALALIVVLIGVVLIARHKIKGGSGGSGSSGGRGRPGADKH